MNKSAFKKIVVLLCVFALLFTSACSKKENEEHPQDETQGQQEQQAISTDDPSGNVPGTGESEQTAGGDTAENNAQKNDQSSQNKEAGGESATGIESVIDENNKVDAAFTYNGKSYGFRKNVNNYLIMGIDRYGEVQKSDSYIGTGQCDALYVLSLDHDNRSYSILQLDRDAMVEMDILGVFGDVVGTEVQQLALAHAYGDGEHLSCENCVNAISKWLKGVSISGYAALQFDALPILNDDIGGVEVYIEDDFSGTDSTLKQGTTVKLSGEHALKFARARMGVSDGKNVSRMRRQRTYLSAFQTQFMSKLKESSDIVNTMFNDVKPYMCTDMSVGAITNAAVKTMDYEFKGIVTIKGTNKVQTYNSGRSYMEFWADEASLNETVINLFCTEIK